MANLCPDELKTYEPPGKMENSADANIAKTVISFAEGRKKQGVWKRWLQRCPADVGTDVKGRKRHLNSSYRPHILDFLATDIQSSVEIA